MNAASTIFKKKSALAEGLLNMGQFHEAETLFRMVLDLAASERIAERNTIPVLDGLGRCLFAQKKWDDAEDAFQRILAILRVYFGDTHNNIALALQNLARVRSARGEHTSAIELGRKAVDILSTNLGPAHPRVAQALFSLSGIKYTAKEFVEAGEDIKASLRIWEKTNGPECNEVALCLSNLARVHEELNEPLQGARLHGRVATLRKKLLGDHPDTAFSLANYGSSLAEAGCLYEAINALQEALDCYERIGGADSPQAEICRRNLQHCKEAAAAGECTE